MGEKVLETDKFYNINKLEKLAYLQVVVNKKKYSCLEEALSWTKMTVEKYTELQVEYLEYSKLYSIRRSTEKFSVVTAILLIYTAIYKYCEEETNGFWPEFFGGEKNYNYQRDVEPVMQLLDRLANMYVNSEVDRCYLTKANLTKIFAQIYLPEVSLRKIFSALYKYYFKDFKGKRIHNITDFFESNETRLDRAANYFISEDNIIENSFEKMIELLDNTIHNNGSVDTTIDLPERFFSTIDEWYRNEKVQIDNKREEYYINTPKLKLDLYNERIILNLPVQKNRNYSDEECGWKISIDNKKEFIEGRVIRKRSGAYLVLEEVLELSQYNIIKIEYIYNGKELGNWNFENDRDYILFDAQGKLIQKDIVTREGLYIGIRNGIEIDENLNARKVLVNNWDQLSFYDVSFENCHENKIVISNSVELEIEDKPIIKRENFKLVFDDWNNSVLFDNIPIYEKYGRLSFDMPNIDSFDLDVRLLNLDSGLEVNIENSFFQNTSGRASLELVDSLFSIGTYRLSIKYKNKNIYRENFVFIDKPESVS
jgi:hypothetical protein